MLLFPLALRGFTLTAAECTSTNVYVGTINEKINNERRQREKGALKPTDIAKKLEFF